MLKKNPIRVADFFCGGGGFSEGFRQAGYNIVFAVDKWEPAIVTYKGNKPGVNVIQDDVIRISKLDDIEFEELVPDSEVIIGSPPCQAFSHSNKSGNGDKTLGIQLIEAYLRIVARKKFKNNSKLKYWILENVPSVDSYIKRSYSAEDLGLKGSFSLIVKGKSSGIYNAKHFGAPTNRRRYLCGDFPEPNKNLENNHFITLGDVLTSLGNPLEENVSIIEDINHQGFKLPTSEVSDHQYVYELAKFEWEKSKRLKRDKGYMGKMSFPENMEKPSRTVMATMSGSSRESMILGIGNERYRLPTVREVASMMGFPIDYRFYGKTKGIKHMLVGNAVSPKMAYALAISIAMKMEKSVPQHYIPISHDQDLEFINLNGKKFLINKEKNKREFAKFKYHIPYLIVKSYRVELTNYHSDFDKNDFRWDVEIHYSQGKVRARKYKPEVDDRLISKEISKTIMEFIKKVSRRMTSFNDFQKIHCMTEENRNRESLTGPYELLESVKQFINKNLIKTNKIELIQVNDELVLPKEILLGYYILSRIISEMEGK